jgi:hypothetical protein
MRLRIIITAGILLPTIGLWFGWLAYRNRRRMQTATLSAFFLLAGMYPFYRVVDLAYWWFLQRSSFTHLSFVLIGVLVLAGIFTLIAWRATLKWRRRLSGLCAAGLLIFGGSVFWYTHRPLPAAIENQVLFNGISYTREIRREPYAMVVHIVKVELDTPGISFLVTPPITSGENDVSARTTSEFLQEFDLQLAINGGFFRPFWSNSPLDFYPQSGDPVVPLGKAASRGDVYSIVERSGEPIVYFSRDNRVSVNSPVGEIYNALNGNFELLRAGNETVRDYEPKIDPRTAIGLDRSGRTLMLLVVDGRQPNYSEGAKMPDLIRMFREHGMVNAVRLDGGGSSTLVMEGEDGNPVVLNSPINAQIPGYERPVATHLGIYAQRLTE